MKFLFRKRSNGKEEYNGTVLMQAEPAVVLEEDLQPELAVVIALALHMYRQRVRQCEETGITIQKFIKPYSPWSSKIYGLRQQPLFVPGLKQRLK